MPLPTAPQPTVTHADLDFGDQGLTLVEFSDGVFALTIDDTRLLVNVEQMQHVVGAFVRLGKDKGWL
jgi:hypothetical protein